MTARLLVPAAAPDGPQPMDITRHLAGVAALIEMCFAAEMDESGRSFIRDLRFLSRLGPALRLLVWLGLSREIWTQGFVWVERGRVIGSVSVQAAGPRSTTWLVANVAVHPEHRRRGIAFALMQSALDFVERQGGAEVCLQVDDDNLGALALYERLAFTPVATHATWTRPGRLAAPPHQPAPFDIRLRSGREWLDELNLAELVRPEGLTWNRPPHPGDFRPTLRRRLERFFNGQVEEHWVAAAAQDRIAGALSIVTGLSDGDRLTLLVHPAFRGQVERPLLVRALRRLGPRPWPVRLEHPADDDAAAEVLRDLGFTVTRTLRWLRRAIRPA